jgi:hypothetical protein
MVTPCANVVWSDLVVIAHRAERGIGDPRGLACAGRPWHWPEAAAVPRRSWRVRLRTRQESTRSQPHSIHTPWRGLSDACGIVRILPLTRRQGGRCAVQRARVAVTLAAQVGGGNSPRARRGRGW